MTVILTDGLSFQLSLIVEFSIRQRLYNDHTQFNPRPTFLGVTFDKGLTLNQQCYLKNLNRKTLTNI
ncbi:hypothetical protein BpHYR1_052334 [Brachionus plicatilis]|uniref:Uncharacterized protein n=1 Tax=Brachionus plicatilis TaxID=10195 RepID=A0A3M7RUD2_BRAPC|nr:hypothetical protein BpHYR1_052334 [Brachionus plicatilis]